MDNRGKVSIIIGCYNVSRWLIEKQLSCILNQTYKDLEVLLINDGSTDDTLDICNSLRENDNRIIVISKENGGLGSARNTGLDHASGDFVWFYDVDDEVDQDLIEKNVSWMTENQTDLNVFGYWCITPSLNLTQEVGFKERIITDNLQLKQIFVEELLIVPNGNGFAWNKFYRRSFLEQCHFRFGNQRIQQDELFNTQLYPKLKRVYISSELLYHYYIYNTGNTRSNYIPNRFDIYLSIDKGLKSFVKDWELNDQRVTDYINQRLYAGINTSIKFNTFHRNAPHSIREKKSIIMNILNRPESVECLNRVDTKKLSLEQKMYHYSYLNKSFVAICVLRYLFNNIRRIKHFIQR